MMTKEQHINYWLNTAQYDWTGTGGAFDTGILITPTTYTKDAPKSLHPNN